MPKDFTASLCSLLHFQLVELPRKPFQPAVAVTHYWWNNTSSVLKSASFSPFEDSSASITYISLFHFIQQQQSSVESNVGVVPPRRSVLVAVAAARVYTVHSFIHVVSWPPLHHCCHHHVVSIVFYKIGANKTWRNTIEMLDNRLAWNVERAMSATVYLTDLWQI